MAKAEFALCIFVVLSCLVLHMISVAYAAGAVNGGPDLQDFVALARNTTDGVEIQILSSFNNYTCDHPSAIPNGTSILVSGHYLPNECIPDFNHCNTEVIPWKEQVFILVPIRNGVAVIKFENHCHLQYINHATPQIMQDCNPIHIYRNSRLLFVACLNLSDSNRYLQLLRLDFDYDSLNSNNTTLFTATPICRKQVVTLMELQILHQEYYWNNSSLAVHCNETVPVPDILTRAIDNMNMTTDQYLLVESRLPYLWVGSLLGVIAVLAVTLTASTTIVIRCKYRLSSGTHTLGTDRTETGPTDIETCPIDTCSSQRQHSCQVSEYPTKHSPVIQFNTPSSCSSTPSYCTSLYHDHMNPSGSKSDSGYSSNSTSVRASFISNNYCETSEHESPEFLYYGHELHTRSPERAYVKSHLPDQTESCSGLLVPVSTHRVAADTQCCTIPVCVCQTSSLCPEHQELQESAHLVSQFCAEGQHLGHQKPIMSTLTDDTDLRTLFPVDSNLNAAATTNSSVPFMDPIDIIHCTSNGGVHYNPVHDITVRIPEGAISKGASVTIEIGIALYGPFQFPDGTKPVSPIVWLCVQQGEHYQFLKPVEVVLPHYLHITTADDASLLHFQKAGHHLNESEQYQFQLASGKVCFSIQKTYGTLSTYHFCFLCIASRTVSQERTAKSKFCLISVIPDPISQPSWTIYFCVCYFLQTCIEAVLRQFPDDFRIQKKTFRFSAPLQAAKIEIDFERQLKGGWILTSQHGTKISASEVDFWSTDLEELQLLHDEKLYPPRVVIRVGGDVAMEDTFAQICIRGVVEDLDTELELRVYRQSLQLMSSDPGLVQPVRAASMPALGYPSSVQRTATSTCRMLVDNAHGEWPMMSLEYPTDQELEGVTNDVLGKLGHDWTKLQHFLQVPDHLMVEIDSEPTVHRRMVRMLKEWRNHSGDESKAKLAECLKASDKRLERTSNSLLSDEYRMLTPPSSRSGSVSSSSTPSSSLGRRMRSIDDTPLSRKNARREYGCGSISETSESATM